MNSSRFQGILIILTGLYVFSQHIGIREPTTITAAMLKHEYPEGLTPVHFVWIHPHLLAPAHNKLVKAKQVAQEWMSILQPGRYKLMFWTDQEILAEFAHLTPVLSRISTPAWISDILRFG